MYNRVKITQNRNFWLFITPAPLITINNDHLKEIFIEILKSFMKINTYVFGTVLYV